MSAPRPYNLIAELTYRCPLRCPYCSNPVELGDFPERLSSADWARVFREANELGIVHVGLTGGEPSTRRDLAEIVAAADAADLFSHLVTAGLPLDREGLLELAGAGLGSVQLSIQDAEAAGSDRIAGTGCFDRKHAFADWVREAGLPLTANVVLHRHNLPRVREMIALARGWGARRLELANTQYHGWALRNRAALLPTRAQLEDAARAVEEERADDGLEIVFVLPDYHGDRPKPCMGGWGRKNLVVTPDGRALPCHAASEIPGLEFWSVADHSLRACWEDAPGMNAYRGEAWMPEPCRSCADRTRDFGGCRCQAFALLGDAGATDPACALAPGRDALVRAREADAASPSGSVAHAAAGFVYRSPKSLRGPGGP